jgi:hypothetical protein
MVDCEAVRKFIRATVTLPLVPVFRLSWPPSLVVSRLAKTIAQLPEPKCCGVRCCRRFFVLCDAIWYARPVHQPRLNFLMRKAQLNTLRTVDIFRSRRLRRSALCVSSSAVRASDWPRDLSRQPLYAYRVLRFPLTALSPLFSAFRSKPTRQPLHTLAAPLVRRPSRSALSIFLVILEPAQRSSNVHFVGVARSRICSRPPC